MAKTPSNPVRVIKWLLVAILCVITLHALASVPADGVALMEKWGTLRARAVTVEDNPDMENLDEWLNVLTLLANGSVQMAMDIGKKEGVKGLNASLSVLDAVIGRGVGNGNRSEEDIKTERNRSEAIPVTMMVTAGTVLEEKKERGQTVTSALAGTSENWTPLEGGAEVTEVPVTDGTVIPESMTERTHPEENNAGQEEDETEAVVTSPAGKAEDVEEVRVKRAKRFCNGKSCCCN